MNLLLVFFLVRCRFRFLARGRVIDGLVLLAGFSAVLLLLLLLLLLVLLLLLLVLVLLLLLLLLSMSIRDDRRIKEGGSSVDVRLLRRVLLLRSLAVSLRHVEVRRRDVRGEKLGRSWEGESRLGPVGRRGVGRGEVRSRERGGGQGCRSGSRLLLMLLRRRIGLRREIGLESTAPDPRR